MFEILTPDLVERIRAYFPRYPSRRAVILPAMHAVHERLGHVPREAVVEIAELLELAPAQVADAMSFYTFFRRDAPHGKTRIWMCRSLGCAVRRSEELVEHACKKLDIRPGETTADGRVTLEVAECLGACDGSPAMLAGEILYTELTEETIDEVLDALP